MSAAETSKKNTGAEESGKPVAAVKPSTHIVIKPVIRAVDLSKVAEFGAGVTPGLVEEKPVVQQTTALADQSGEEKKRGYLIRLTQSQVDRIEQVYTASTFKTKQSIGEVLLMEAVDALGKKLGV